MRAYRIETLKVGLQVLVMEQFEVMTDQIVKVMEQLVARTEERNYRDLV